MSMLLAITIAAVKAHAPTEDTFLVYNPLWNYYDTIPRSEYTGDNIRNHLLHAIVYANGQVETMQRK